MGLFNSKSWKEISEYNEFVVEQTTKTDGKKGTPIKENPRFRYLKAAGEDPRSPGQGDGIERTPIQLRVEEKTTKRLSDDSFVLSSKVSAAEWTNKCQTPSGPRNNNSEVAGALGADLAEQSSNDPRTFGKDRLAAGLTSTPLSGKPQ